MTGRLGPIGLIIRDLRTAAIDFCDERTALGRAPFDDDAGDGGIVNPVAEIDVEPSADRFNGGQGQVIGFEASDPAENIHVFGDAFPPDQDVENPSAFSLDFVLDELQRHRIDPVGNRQMITEHPVPDVPVDEIVPGCGRHFFGKGDPLAVDRADPIGEILRSGYSSFDPKRPGPRRRYWAKERGSANGCRAIRRSRRPARPRRRAACGPPRAGEPSGRDRPPSRESPISTGPKSGRTSDPRALSRLPG